MNTLLLTLFDKYAELLKQRFSEDFLEIVGTDDYMPMPINTIEEYDKVVTVSWYTPDKEREKLTYVFCIHYHEYVLTNDPPGSLSYFLSRKCIPSVVSTFAIFSTRLIYSRTTIFSDLQSLMRSCGR
jgi:hypothetical protein